MMNQGDDQRGRIGYPEQQRPGYPLQRKPANTNKYPEKNGNYSPSTSYKYNPHSSYSMQGGPQRKRMNSYDNGNSSGGIEKIARQNDIIIRLLKEIRDHLVYGANRAERPAAEIPANDTMPEMEAKAFVQSDPIADEPPQETTEAGNENGDLDAPDEQDA